MSKKVFNFEEVGNEGICKSLHKYYVKWFKENEYEDDISEVKEYCIENALKSLHADEEEWEDFFESLFDIIIVPEGAYEECLECNDFDI